MLRILASGLVAAGVLVGSVAPAEASPLVDKADRHGDIAVHGSTDGVDPAVVGSVDLRHVTVTRQRDGLRVVIRLKQVLPTPGRWFQSLGLSLSPPPGWVGPGWFFAAFATPQHLGSSMALFVDAVGGDEHKPVTCHVAAKKGDKVVRLVIPEKCLPTQPGHLTVDSGLLDKRGDNPLVVADRLTVGGLVDLQRVG